YVLNGEVRGSIVQIRPSNLAAVIVTVGNLSKHLNVDVGSPVLASATRLGTIVDLSKLIQQTVSKYTSDAGNHVSLQVSPAPGASLLLCPCGSSSPPTSRGRGGAVPSSRRSPPSASRRGSTSSSPMRRTPPTGSASPAASRLGCSPQASTRSRWATTPSAR